MGTHNVCFPHVALTSNVIYLVLNIVVPAILVISLCSETQVLPVDIHLIGTLTHADELTIYLTFINFVKFFNVFISFQFPLAHIPVRHSYVRAYLTSVMRRTPMVS